MASAQVLRKQEHLEAGKRKLEEFRKKKAAERAKKATSGGQLHASDVSLQEKHHPEDDHVRITDSNGADTSDGHDKAVSGSSLVTSKNDNKLVESGLQRSLKDTDANSHCAENNFSSCSSDMVQNYSKNKENEVYSVSGSSRSVVNNSQETKDMNSDSVIYSNDQARLPYGSMSDQFLGHTQMGQDHSSDSSKSSFYGLKEMQSKENDSSLKASTVVNSLHDFITKISPQNSVSSLLQSKPNTDVTLGNGRVFHTSFEDSTQPSTSIRGSGLEVGQNTQGGSQFISPVNFDMGQGNPSSSISTFPNMHGAPVKASKSSGFRFEDRSSSNNVPTTTNEFASRRSRPSFLDSLNVPRSSSGMPFQRTGPEKASLMSNSSSFESMDVLGSSAVQKPSVETDTTGPFSQTKTSNVSSAIGYFGNSSVPASNGGGMLRLGSNENSMERKDELFSSKQNEDFAALEQHIEDLTQEKFSLQRSLEASRTLAESLAAENTSLTDSYNQQRSIVNQLKSDMEKLQQEIKAQLLELESVRNEYANARLECSAADERASILASEVIGLEEKALRLRSTELKLERQLQNSQAEISSYKKKMSSLEKDRQDLQSTIDALQEEKKLLQSKLRKASGSVKSIDFNRSPTSRKDVSTSTEDLANSDATEDNSNQEVHDTPRGIGASISPLQLENGELALEVSDVNIPSDQMRMIQNINALISELALEKEELIQALSSELSQSSKLQDLNKELSRKLEAQTQRLELLTAQNMAHENTSIRLPDSQIIHENTAYADEGDEVVERVLGWIMKLFPGGPSRRRTSKLL